MLLESFESGLIYGSAWMSVLWSQEKLLYLHVMVSYYIKRSHKSNTKNDTNVYDGCLSISTQNFQFMKTIDIIAFLWAVCVKVKTK